MFSHNEDWNSTHPNHTLGTSVPCTLFWDVVPLFFFLCRSPFLCVTFFFCVSPTVQSCHIQITRPACDTSYIGWRCNGKKGGCNLQDGQVRPAARRLKTMKRTKIYWNLNLKKMKNRKTKKIATSRWKFCGQTNFEPGKNTNKQFLLWSPARYSYLCPKLKLIN